ncbi:MAG TPA: DUF5696 domain-containing protein, partial [Tepiditoga sp.]|nr:DUF5696 domain-containing protein [Tepiditoga sp.]
TKKKILGKEYIKMTDLDDVKNIISDFKNYNVIFNIEGYSENGYSNSFPENLPISRSFADNKDFKQFNSDNNVYYTVDYLKGII